MLRLKENQQTFENLVTFRKSYIFRILKQIVDLYNQKCYFQFFLECKIVLSNHEKVY